MKEEKTNNKPTRKEANRYFNYSADTGGLSSFSNKDLVCKDCKYRLDSVVKCKIYCEKPGKVIYNGPCSEYEKE